MGTGLIPVTAVQPRNLGGENIGAAQNVSLVRHSAFLSQMPSIGSLHTLILSLARLSLLGHALWFLLALMSSCG